MIPYGKQDINQDDIDAVLSALQSDFLTQGPQVPLFEASIKKAVNVDYAFAVNSATNGRIGTISGLPLRSAVVYLFNRLAYKEPASLISCLQ